MEKEILDNNASAKGQVLEGACFSYQLKWTQKAYGVLKACIDFFGALVALILLSPLFLVVAIAIKVESKGPVFFTQKRIGKNGKIFKCIKFRSMSMEAKHDVAGYEYQEVNAYITKVGKVIRKLSIDELPQLFKILAFQMAFIGFRPSQECETELNEERERYGMYQIRPGISGWAQINGRDLLAAHPKEKAKFDAYYLQKFSLWLDVKIFFKTIGIVFRSDNVEEGVIEESKVEEEVATTQENEVNE